MKRDEAPVAKINCPACDGRGFTKIKQAATQPDRIIYAARCERCAGKGRIAESRS